MAELNKKTSGLTERLSVCMYVFLCVRVHVCMHVDYKRMHVHVSLQNPWQAPAGVLWHLDVEASSGDSHHLTKFPSPNLTSVPSRFLFKLP